MAKPKVETKNREFIVTDTMGHEYRYVATVFMTDYYKYPSVFYATWGKALGSPHTLHQEDFEVSEDALKLIEHLYELNRILY